MYNTSINVAESVKQENMENNWDNIAVEDLNSNHFFGTVNDANNCSEKLKAAHEIIPLNWNTQIKQEPHTSIVSTEVLKEPLQIKNENCDVPAAGSAGITPRRPSNLRLAWTPQDSKAACCTVSTGAIPKAYRFKDVYELKRQDALRKQEEDQRKARQFHSQPVPNFKACHKRLNEIPIVHKITIPKTPEIMKRWYADSVRKKERQEQETSIETKKVSHIPQTESKRFCFNADQRVKERLDCDTALKCKWEKKSKQENDCELD